jgi:hypothetical protein
MSIARVVGRQLERFEAAGVVMSELAGKISRTVWP